MKKKNDRELYARNKYISYMYMTKYANAEVFSV